MIRTPQQIEEMHYLTGGVRGHGPPVGCKVVFFHYFIQFATVRAGRGRCGVKNICLSLDYLRAPLVLNTKIDLNSKFNDAFFFFLKSFSSSSNEESRSLSRNLMPHVCDACDNLDRYLNLRVQTFEKCGHKTAIQV